MEKVSVRIEGISPLLQHRYPLEDSGNKSKTKNTKQTQDDVKKALYQHNDGTIYEPSTHILGTLQNAGAKFQIQGQGKSTFRKIVGSGAVIIDPDAIPHEMQNYEIDVRPVVIKKARIPRSRPMFRKWALSFVIEYDEEDLPKTVLKELLDYAGRRVGIGDFRPACGGPFGKFMVTKFE